MKGVLDRIENGYAVILIETLKEELIISKEKLPIGSVEGTWFHLKKTNDSYSIVSIDKETTEKNKRASMDLMEQLQRKKKTSKFKRK